MPGWQLRYAIACCAITGWSLAYALASWSRWPRLIYDPLARDWYLATHATTPVPIDYIGLIAWGAGGAAVGAGVALAGSRVWRRRLPRSVEILLGAWALTAFALAGTYFTWMLWPFDF